ncbi:PE-PPE domain-containing protein [Mycobacterium tuberculosis]
MSFVFAVPEMVAATASDLASLGAALSEATAAAAIPTTQVLAAAADEVSAAIAELFGAHGQEFQALSAQASAFHDRFVRALSAAAGWYVDAEAANAALVDTAATGASELGSGGRTALILGSTGTPRPPFDYMQQVYDRYIAPHYLGYAFSGLYTPAQFQPWTGIPSLTYDQSVAEGAGYLHTAIMQQVAAGNDVVVLGFSQGASVATLEMRHLASLPAGVAPSPDQLSFVLLGNPNNPNGGILARLLDLIEPDLRAIIELGYDRTGYADVPTPAALFPVHIDPIAVPPQIGAAIGGPLTALDGLLDTVINDQLNPVVTSGIYQAGAELSVAAAGYGAPAGVTNAIFIGQQVLPILVEGPGALVTADTHYLVDAIQDLAAGDLSGFNQNLQLIPATNIALLVFAAGIPAVAAVAILTGQDFPV